MCDKERRNEIINKLCDLLHRNDNLTMQEDYFDKKLSEIEFCIAVLEAMQENDEEAI